jgi:SAM-dependent methyltransferase
MPVVDLPRLLASALGACVVAFALYVVGNANAQLPAPPRNAGPVVATPTSIVDEILELAGVSRNDFVVDLGSGDGRIVIAAVARYGARGGFGVDISPEMVALSNQNAVKAGVGDRVHFYERDLFATDVREATVVTVYLLPSVMGQVERKLRAELRPGTRVVVHDFPFPEWQAERSVSVESLDKIKVTGFTSSQIYLYRMPERP